MNRVTSKVNATCIGGWRPRVDRWMVSLLAGAALTAGCRGLGPVSDSRPTSGPYTAQKAAETTGTDADNAVVQTSFWDRFRKAQAPTELESVTRDRNGEWRPESQAGAAARARSQQFAAAEQLFRREDYKGAASAFKSLSKRVKDTPEEEDALFMLAESYFKLDKLPIAQDTYARLLIKFPTTRYLPQAVQRTYDIAYYWLEDSQLRSQGKPSKHNWFTNSVNLVDRTRPLFDTPGRAIEAIETIQQHDPFGPLTDDALMMAGAYKFVNGNFFEAAGYYEQLANDQPKSEHAGRALVLGAQSYLRAYQGPEYEGQDLESAEKLNKIALARTTDLTTEQRTRLEQDLRVIYLEKAKREYQTATLYRRLKKPKAARYYYEQVLREYADTDWARRAEQDMKEIDVEAGQPPSSVDRFSAWLAEKTEPTRKRPLRKGSMDGIPASNDAYAGKKPTNPNQTVSGTLESGSPASSGEAQTADREASGSPVRR